MLTTNNSTPTRPLAQHNEVLLNHDELTRVLTYLSTVLPAFFPAPVRLVVHGGACMLLHPGLYAINREGQTPPKDNQALPTNKRTATRDVDYIHRSFVVEWKHKGMQDPGERLAEAVKRTAAVFGLGSDWMNADADVALPTAVDPRTGQAYDPIYVDSIAPNNVAMHTIFRSPNGMLELISVTPAWAVALKLVRYTKYDPEDIGALLKNGTRISNMAPWTPASLESWILNTCAPMGYKNYDARKLEDLRAKMHDAVSRLSPFNATLAKSGSWGGSDFRAGRGHSHSQSRHTWPLTSSSSQAQTQMVNMNTNMSTDTTTPGGLWSKAALQAQRSSPALYRDPDVQARSTSWPHPISSGSTLDDPNFASNATRLGQVLSASNSMIAAPASSIYGPVQGRGQGLYSGPSQTQVYTPERTQTYSSSPERAQVYSSPERTQVYSSPERAQVYSSPSQAPVYSSTTSPPQNQIYANSPQAQIYSSPSAQQIYANEPAADDIVVPTLNPDDEYHDRKDHSNRERDRERKKREKAARKEEKMRRKEARALRAINGPSSSNTRTFESAFNSLSMRQEESPDEEFSEDEEDAVELAKRAEPTRVRSPFGRGSSVTVLGGPTIVSDITLKTQALFQQQHAQEHHQGKSRSVDAYALEGMYQHQQQQQQQYWNNSHHQPRQSRTIYSG